jgi:transcriptional regulator with XRE-family HTH domain/anti-sigma regulatory factor (Ser/Thr protein kinase)
MDEITIGARLRTLRRWRGLTQVELADRAGVSSSFVSMVEHGTRLLDRRSHIAALADALRVSETDLVGGPHLSSDRLQSDPHMAIPPLRVALQTNSLSRPAVDRARPLAELASVVTVDIASLRRDCNYVAIGKLLPDVLDELHYHVAVPADEATQQLALWSLVEACSAGSFIAKNLRHPDLAYLAALRAKEAAILLGEPVALGQADFAWLSTLSRAGSQDRNLSANAQAAEQLVRSSEHRSGVGPASHAVATTQGLRAAPQWSYLELAALPTAPSCARLHTKQVLWEWGLTKLSEDGELVVSELTTNAVRITNVRGLLTPIRLWLTNRQPRVLIEVWDGHMKPPAQKALDADGLPPQGNEGGRGLFLVSSLCERWGWYPDKALAGKVVWGVVGGG